MFSFLGRLLPGLRRTWKPLHFSHLAKVRIPANQRIEEETIPDYVASRYYPVRIGDVFRDRYQIVGKLGFGASSTVWLARDLRFANRPPVARQPVYGPQLTPTRSYCRHVTLKLFINSASLGSQVDDELNIYKRLKEGPRNHPGRGSVRSLLDVFDIDGPEGQHRCLVHRPLWESVATFLKRNPIERLPKPVLAVLLQRLFLALDYLHTECQIIHTDIKATNIMFDFEDNSVLDEYEMAELQDPSPRKETEGRTIYVSRQLRVPKEIGAPVLCDFGSAVPGDEEHLEDVQPDIYRAPEVILEAPWTYSIDIWNTGCMIWDVFEGGNLFTGYDPEFRTYRSRTHIAEMVALLGPPPLPLLSRGKSSSKFFSSDGNLATEIQQPDYVPLEQRETSLERQEKIEFLEFVHKMLQWDPRNRGSARTLAQDEWLLKNL